MKRLISISRHWLIVLVIGLLILAYGVVQAISPQAPPMPAPPTLPPVDHTQRYVGTPPTATPRLGEIRPSVESVTSTPLPISRTIDFARGLPDKEKYVLIVRHPDGKYDKYLIPISQWDNRRQFVGLGTQDVIVREYPLVPLPPSTPHLSPAIPIYTPSPRPYP